VSKFDLSLKFCFNKVEFCTGAQTPIKTFVMNNKTLENIYYSDSDRILRGCYYLLDIFERRGSGPIAEKEAENYLCGVNGFTIKEALEILKKFRLLYSHSGQVLQNWPTA
jgi:hypothetical protein